MEVWEVERVNNHPLRFLLLLLVFIWGLVTPVLAEGNGEITVLNNHSMFMSYDSEIKQVQSPFLYDNEGFNYYFLESDKNISVNLSIDWEDDKVNFLINNAPNIITERYTMTICFQQGIKELNRFQIVNDGSRCHDFLYAYEIDNILVGYPYSIIIPRSIQGNKIPFEWFIGEGAGGGAGCICFPGITDASIVLNGVNNNYDINSEDVLSYQVNWVGNNNGCPNSEAQIQYRVDDGVFDIVPTGSSSNFGNDLVDCNGTVCKTVSPAQFAFYNKGVDMQQQDNNVDFIAVLYCAGEVFDGKTSIIHHSSIWDNTPPYIVWNNPTPNNTTSNINVLLNGTPIDNRVPVHAFWEFNNDVLGYWSMDHYNSSVVFDNSSYGNDLSLNVITVNDWDDGIIGLAPEFPLAYSYLGLSNNVTIRPNMSFSLWYYLTSATGSYKMIIGDNTLNSHLGVWYDNRLRLKEDDGTTFDFSGDGIIASWNHLVVVNDGSYWRIYNNGVEVANATQSGNFNINRIGHAYSTTSFSWNGFVDEVIIFNRTLSVNEINNLYNSTYDNIQKQYYNLSVNDTINYTVWLNDLGSNEVRIDRWFMIIESLEDDGVWLALFFIGLLVFVFLIMRIDEKNE